MAPASTEPFAVWWGSERWAVAGCHRGQRESEERSPACGRRRLRKAFSSGDFGASACASASATPLRASAPARGALLCACAARGFSHLIARPQRPAAGGFARARPVELVMAQLCGPRRCPALLALLASLFLFGAEAADGERDVHGECPGGSPGRSGRPRGRRRDVRGRMWRVSWDPRDPGQGLSGENGGGGKGRLGEAHRGCGGASSGRGSL